MANHTTAAERYNARMDRIFAKAKELKLKRKDEDSKKDCLNMLRRLAEEVRCANSIQHSGGKVSDEVWADLYQLTNEAFAIIAEAEQARFPTHMAYGFKE